MTRILKPVQSNYHIFLTIIVFCHPTGNFIYFINELEIILNALHNTNTQFINCSNINIHFLVENNNNNKKTFRFLVILV